MSYIIDLASYKKVRRFRMCKTMADKIMLNFRCPGELLDAIDTLGQKRHPSETSKHGCDRTKTLLDIVRAGIEALSEGWAVLPMLDKAVRRCKTDNVIDIESRFAAIEQRLGKIEGLNDSPELPKPDVEVAESFEGWLALYLLLSLTIPSILIMDNAPIHRKTAIRLLVEEASHQILFLPKYSPDLNDIEHDFSALKRAIMYSHSATSLDEIIRAYCAT
jgi:hypothetical protein